MTNKVDIINMCGALSLLQRHNAKDTGVDINFAALLDASILLTAYTGELMDFVHTGLRGVQSPDRTAILETLEHIKGELEECAEACGTTLPQL